MWRKISDQPRRYKVLDARAPAMMFVTGAMIVVPTLLICWPGVHGFWGRDDYPLLAMVRMLDAPWLFFFHDHYVAPGSVFRPMGFAMAWLGAKLFGPEYPPHAMVDIGLHALVALALYGVVRQARVARIPAVLCTLVFALHPAVTGTAMWWAARFDLLATGCILIALLAAQVHCQDGRLRSLLLGAVAMLAGMLSKEIGLVAVAAALALWLYWAWRHPGWRKAAWRAGAIAIGCGLVFLLWRWAVLGTPSSKLTGGAPIVEIIVRGLAIWVRQAPGYLSFWGRLDTLQHAGLVLGTAVFLISVVAGRAWKLNDRQVGLLLMGSCLLLLPAVLQAPIMVLNADPLRAEVSAVETAMQSRLYYLGMAGIAMIAAALLAAVWSHAARLPRLGGALAVVIVLLVFGSQSRIDARRYAERSWAIAGVARAASQAVTHLDLPAAHCHVAFTGIKPPPEWGIYVSVDWMVKALAPNPARVEHCWFHSNYRTWYYLLHAPVSVQDAEPYRPLTIDGRREPWRHVGSVVVALLDPASDSDSGNARVVLGYHDGRFVPASRTVPPDP